MKRYFVTAIGTDSGKTVVAAILCKALRGAYWKPIQAGQPKDYDTVARWLGSAFSGYPEVYTLRTPIAPHLAARQEGRVLCKEEIIPPETKKPLIVEGAGGCMVPLNQEEYMIDLAAHCGAHHVVLVANLYLGAINHTILTAKMMPKHLKCSLVINGPADPAVEDTLLTHTQLPLLLRIYPEKEMNAQTIARYSRALPLHKL